jgi:CRISPR/Cas system-associated endonuclease Cas3-HD
MNTIQECKLALKELKQELKNDPDVVLKLLKKAGILTPTGKLSKRYKDENRN